IIFIGRYLGPYFGMSLLPVGIVLRNRYYPGLYIIAPPDLKGFDQLLPDILIVYRATHFHPEIDIPRHPVGRRDIYHRVSSVPEYKQPGVFQEFVHDAYHLDMLAHTRHSGNKATGSADNHLYFHS